MNEQAKKPTSIAKIGAAVGGIVLLLSVAAWFLLISPKRSEASKLEEEIAATEQQLSAARLAAREADRVPPIRYADLFRLAKAMPDDSDHAGIVLDLNEVATDSGIQFDEILPGNTQTLAEYRLIPIELRFNGNFYNLADFLFRLRNLVGVDDGRLTATGRLFTIERLVVGENEEGFPQIDARLTVSAFLYGSGSSATPSSSTAAPTPGTTATTTTTTSEPLPVP